MYYAVKYTTDNGINWNWISYHSTEADAINQQLFCGFLPENTNIELISESQRQQYFTII